MKCLNRILSIYKITILKFKKVIKKWQDLENLELLNIELRKHTSVINVDIDIKKGVKSGGLIDIVELLK